MEHFARVSVGINPKEPTMAAGVPFFFMVNFIPSSPIENQFVSTLLSPRLASNGSIDGALPRNFR